MNLDGCTQAAQYDHYAFRRHFLQYAGFCILQILDSTCYQVINKLSFSSTFIPQGGSWVSTGSQAARYGRYAFRRHFLQHAGFRIVRTLDDSQDPPVSLMPETNSNHQGKWCWTTPFGKHAPPVKDFGKSLQQREYVSYVEYLAGLFMPKAFSRGSMYLMWNILLDYLCLKPSAGGVCILCGISCWIIYA